MHLRSAGGCVGGDSNDDESECDCDAKVEREEKVAASPLVDASGALSGAPSAGPLSGQSLAKSPARVKPSLTPLPAEAPQLVGAPLMPEPTSTGGASSSSSMPNVVTATVSSSGTEAAGTSASDRIMGLSINVFPRMDVSGRGLANSFQWAEWTMRRSVVMGIIQVRDRKVRGDLEAANWKAFRKAYGEMDHFCNDFRQWDDARDQKKFMGNYYRVAKLLEETPRLLCRGGGDEPMEACCQRITIWLK